MADYDIRVLERRLTSTPVQSVAINLAQAYRRSGRSSDARSLRNIILSPVDRAIRVNIQKTLASYDAHMNLLEADRELERATYENRMLDLCAGHYEDFSSATSVLYLSLGIALIVSEFSLIAGGVIAAATAYVGAKYGVNYIAAQITRRKHKQRINIAQQRKNILDGQYDTQALGEERKLLISKKRDLVDSIG